MQLSLLVRAKNCFFKQKPSICWVKGAKQGGIIKAILQTLRKVLWYFKMT